MNVTLRSRGGTFVLVGLAVLSLLLIAVPAIASSEPIGAKIVFTAIAVAMAGCAARAATTCVIVQDDGIVVKNSLRTRRSDWAAIDRFVFGSMGLNVGCGIVVLVDGGRYPLQGIRGRNPAFFKSSPGAERLIAQLNEALRRANHRL